MKKATSLLLSATLLLLTVLALLPSCKKTKGKTEDLPLGEISLENYTVEDAKDDGYVVFVNNDVTSGQKIWSSFVKKTQSKTPAKVRYFKYFPDSSSSFLFELEYNGETYTDSHYEGDKLITNTFKYMIKCEEEPPTESASYSSLTAYILADDKTVTYNDIMKSYISSSSNNFIYHSIVYTDYVYKDK